ncbi:hypothetical protein PVAND_013851 [Polypedilum vanderplanki]|uniref:Uncharacterized protein n=1 Tax=Polypedilum vanderplanki TaxID=319348 RepID=A0A9J6CRH4_POLVA|nr:hypothetical protein PVAND_013851 [Polypedilum vanderplanki]
MGKLLKSLQLQTFLILWIIYTVNGAPYSKYGRTCKDIGCLPREQCVMAYDTCSFNQQENTNCGRYPTCQKRVDAPPPPQNSGPILNPAPENTRVSSNDGPPRDSINPNNVFGFPSSNNYNPYPQMPPQQIPLDIPRLPDNKQPFPASPNQGNNNMYQYPYFPQLTPPPNVFFFPTPPPANYYKPMQPSGSSSIINNASLNLMLLGLLFLLIYRPPSTQPTLSIWNIPTTTTTIYTTTTTRPTTTTTRRQWTTKPMFYNPSNPTYGGGGSFFGSRFDDDDPFNSFRTRTTTSTRRPFPSSSGSSDSLGGFFSGLSSLLSGDVGKLISGALSNRGGSSSSGGGFFDTRPVIENKGYRGGLFSENTGSHSLQKPSETYGGYPVTRDNTQLVPQQPAASNPSTSNQQASHGKFGWKLN